MVTSEMFLEPIYAFVIDQSEVEYSFTYDLFSTQNIELIKDMKIEIKINYQ